jgi:hypothetical protein
MCIEDPKSTDFEKSIFSLVLLVEIARIPSLMVAFTIVLDIDLYCKLTKCQVQYSGLNFDELIRTDCQVLVTIYEPVNQTERTFDCLTCLARCLGNIL